MIRAVRALPLLFLSLLLVSCGTEETGGGADTGTGSTADPAELDARARALGIAPELVYVTEAPGFAVAQQSVGVYGGDGFSAVYVSQESRAQLELFVDRGTLTAENCARTQVGQGSGKAVTCERDGDAWYREDGGRHEYAVPRDGHVATADCSGPGSRVTPITSRARPWWRTATTRPPAICPPSGSSPTSGTTSAPAPAERFAYSRPPTRPRTTEAEWARTTPLCGATPRARAEPSTPPSATLRKPTRTRTSAVTCWVESAGQAHF